MSGRLIPRPVWTAGLAMVLVLAVLVGLELAPARFPSQQISDSLQLVLALLAAVSCGRAARRSSGPARAFWGMFAAFALTWATGQVLWTFGGALVRARVLASWDPFFLLTAVPLLAAFATRPDRPRRSSVGFMIDVGLLFMVGLYVYVYVAVGHAISGDVQQYARWLNLLLNLRAVLVLACLLWLLYTSRPPWRRLYGELAAVLAFLFGGSTFCNLVLLSGSYRPGLRDLPWTLSFVWLAFIAGHRSWLVPAAAAEGEDLSGGWSEMRRGTVLAVLAIVLIPVFHLAVMAVSSPPAPLVILRRHVTVVASLLIGGLFVLRQFQTLRRVEGIVRRHEAARSAALDTLRERESLLSTIIDSEPESVKLIDRQGGLLTVNPAGLGMIEADHLEAVRGRCFYDLALAPHRGSLRAMMQEVFEGRAGRLEFEIAGLKGGQRWLDTHAVPLPDGSGGIAAVLAISRDITERRGLEERYRQAHKLEAVGRLAGGIAHDFNNLLSVILGYDELLLKRLPAGDPSRRYAEVIQDAVERSTNLIQQLLAFSRQQVLRPKVLDVTEVMRELEGILRRLIREDIELVCQMGPDLGRVWADPGQVGQVIMNLVVNARDAMPDGGRLTIEARNVDLPASVVQGAPVKEGPYVEVSMRDTGIGMDAATQRRIFEPFFTTKERGKGSGLGLATVYGIVKQSGGYIWVESEPGRGTAFTIWLPRSFGDPQQAAPAPAPERLGGTETVLLVEDEDGMRDVVRHLLEEQGYHVIEASCGPDALEAARAHQGAIHVLLTDVIMQHMNGWELSERILRIRPETKVVFMSGYADEVIGRYGVLDPGITLLQKPFSVAELGRKLREVLALKAAAGLS